LHYFALVQYIVVTVVPSRLTSQQSQATNLSNSNSTETAPLLSSETVYFVERANGAVAAK
jgi:hypothetical protein